MNPKCQTRPVFDTFSAKSAHLTGLKMRRITRAASIDHLVGAGEQAIRHGETERLREFSVDLDSVSKQERKMIAHCPIPATPGSRKTAARVTVGCRICLER